jgi:hypothetical protein
MSPSNAGRPDLDHLAESHAEALRASGIERITAKSGWLGRSVQVITKRGAIHFR